MSSSTERVPGEEAAIPGGGASERALAAPVMTVSRPGNGFATASLAAGLAGITLITIVPALVLGILGLRRAGRRGWRGRGSGLARSCAGIGFAVLWAAAGAVLVPHLARAADPGCTAYKGAALTAYKKVIADFNTGNDRVRLTQDLAGAIVLLNAAAARSHSSATAGAISRLSHQLHRLLIDVQDGRVVSDAALGALNRDATRTDTACGTLRV